MDNLASVTFWILLGLVVGQGLMVLGWLWVLVRRKAVAKSGDTPYCPKAAVVLCLRGSDPFLPDCIEALLDQDYPEYEVKIVVDCREDPAWEIVEEVIERRQATNVEMRPLKEPLSTCGLKCSSLVQAVSGLDESYEVVAQLDADTIPHPTWLRELVAPLADPRVGVSTGNRWYMPGDGTWGALVRYSWNAAAVVQMYLYGIPWGGTLATRAVVFRQSDLLDRWSNAFCEDTMLYQAMKEQGLRVAFVPSLMIVNRESCDLSNFLGFVTRQLLTARLYHPRWGAVVVHGIGTTLAMLSAICLSLAALSVGNYQAAAWAGGGLAVYLAAMPLLLIPMEAVVQSIVRARGESTAWLGGITPLKLAAIPLTQLVYPVALISAIFLRTVDWRGIRYRINGPFDIRMIEYRPYRSTREDRPDSRRCSV